MCGVFRSDCEPAAVCGSVTRRHRGCSRALEELIAPAGGLTVPSYLLEPRESVVDSPPVQTRSLELPFGQLSWPDFERLVFRLARENLDVVYSAPYGRPGQAQDGIDVYARLSGGGHICWQARNRQQVRASDIEKAVDDFLKGKWATSAKRFVFCVRASLADTRPGHSVQFEVWQRESCRVCLYSSTFVCGRISYVSFLGFLGKVKHQARLASSVRTQDKQNFTSF